MPRVRGSAAYRVSRKQNEAENVTFYLKEVNCKLRISCLYSLFT